MTPSEFKAWFEGFTEAFSGTPTKAQWARIKERVGEIDGKPITEKVFVERWWPYIQRYPEWIYVARTTTAVPTYSATLQTQAANLQAQALQAQAAQYSAMYNSNLAMNAVGRAEAAQLTG